MSSNVGLLSISCAILISELHDSALQNTSSWENPNGIDLHNHTLSSDVDIQIADVGSRSVENSRLVIAAVFIVLLLIGEAALFAYAVKTMPDFLSQADVQVP